MLSRIILRPFLKPMLVPAPVIHKKNYCVDTLNPTNDTSVKTEKQVSDTSFATLLRNSTFVQMGNPIGKVVVGKIYHIVDDDFYVDFGGKFHCVCARPRGPSGRAYTRGAEVRLRIKKLESSQKFLGFDKEMSLLEAECILLGLNK